LACGHGWYCARKLVGDGDGGTLRPDQSWEHHPVMVTMIVIIIPIIIPIITINTQ
jgi:hypothetical protein